MSAFILILSSLVASSIALDNIFEMKNILHKIHECAEQEHATPEEVEKMLKDVLPESRQGACTIFCVHKIYNVQNDDGSLNFEGALETLEKFKEHDDDGETAIRAALKCKDVAPVPDGCDYAEKIADCFVREARALGLKQFMFL